MDENHAVAVGDLNFLVVVTVILGGSFVLLFFLLRLLRKDTVPAKSKQHVFGVLFLTYTHTHTHTISFLK